MGKICKMPAWAVAHCPVSKIMRKTTVCFDHQSMLGKAADHAYLIVGKLKTQFPSYLWNHGQDK